MAVAVYAATLQLAPRPDRDPAAEQHQGKAGHNVHHVTETRGERDPGKPDDQGDDERGHDVTRSRHQGSARRLATGPATLPGNEGDRHPMVGDDGMQHTNGGDRENEENRRVVTGSDSMAASEIFGQSFELVQCLRGVHAATAHGITNAMFHMVLDQRPLSVVDDAFHGLKLLRQIKAGATILEHGEDRGELAMSLLQPFDDVGVRDVLHTPPYPLGGRG
jgi:hypothetical protein